MAAIPASLRELASKAVVCAWVEVSGARLWRRAGGDLVAGLAAARARGTFAELWLVEGLGLAAAEAACAAGRPLREVLHGEGREALPQPCLAMLNAGLGLGLARQVLGALPPAPAHRVVAAAVDRFHQLCHAGATPGYEAAALQGAGFVARVWHASRLPALLVAARAIDEDLAACMWHAVGRAVYFLPRHFPPVGDVHRRTFARLAAEAPDPASHHQAAAGLVLAAVLTNMRQPAVVERLLAAAIAGGVAATTLCEGVRGACGVRADATPDDPGPAALAAHRPRLLADEDWEALVRVPYRLAVAELPVLRRERRLGELIGAGPQRLAPADRP